MNNDDIESWQNKDKDFVLAHYHEVGEESRLYDRLIWEVPSIAIVIISALLIAAYAYAPNLLLRMILTALAAVWAFGMIIFAVKHQYFVGLKKIRLMTLEEKCFGMLNLQRFTDPDKAKNLKLRKSHWERPEGLQHQSAHRWLMGTLWIMFVSLVGLTIWNLVDLLTCTF